VRDDEKSPGPCAVTAQGSAPSSGPSDGGLGQAESLEGVASAAPKVAEPDPVRAKDAASEADALTRAAGDIPPSAVPAMRRIEARLGRRPLRDILARPPRNAFGRWGHTFAALDLGTNNCRLLIARPHRTGFRVLDAYSRTVRLGEGLTSTQTLSPTAMERTIEALKVCAGKIERRGVTQFRAVATQACRSAMNAREFLSLAESETGISFDIITAREEARLAVESCANLIDRECDNILVFDIGGGSTELVWLDRRQGTRVGAPMPMRAWTSLPHGVVSLTEEFGGSDGVAENPAAVFDAMVAKVRNSLKAFPIPPEVRGSITSGRAHMVGNSGTVTTIAGVLIGLQRYDRARVDGAWIDLSAATRLARDLARRPRAERAEHPCIGTDRADLLLPGAAILEAIQSVWPCQRLRVADRGLREGVLLAMMARADRRARQRRAAQRLAGQEPEGQPQALPPPASDQAHSDES
jgi:exopolyphosphatase/guanosine-5'-triphosphate,3'-diphosphate pyrophosphatase